MSGPVAALLPAMTLNASAFPPLDVEVTAVECSELAQPLREDALARRAGLRPYVEALRERLRGDERWRCATRRIVVGHSFGGLLALAWLAEEPRAAVDALVLTGVTAGPVYERLRLRFGPWRLSVGKLVPWWNRPLVTRAVKRLHTRGALGPRRVDFAALRRRSDFAVDRAGWRNTDWRVLRALRIAVESYDVRAALHTISTPTIVLHGTRDALFELREGARLAAGLPRGELRVIEGAGHALPLTHPEALRAAVRDAVAGNRWAARPGSASTLAWPSR